LLARLHAFSFLGSSFSTQSRTTTTPPYKKKNGDGVKAVEFLKLHKGK
jgi:hypothetical protein